MLRLGRVAQHLASPAPSQAAAAAEPLDAATAIPANATEAHSLPLDPAARQLTAAEVQQYDQDVS